MLFFMLGNSVSSDPLSLHRKSHCYELIFCECLVCGLDPVVSRHNTRPAKRCLSGLEGELGELKECFIFDNRKENKKV